MGVSLCITLTDSIVYQLRAIIIIMPYIIFIAAMHHSERFYDCECPIYTILFIKKLFSLDLFSQMYVEGHLVKGINFVFQNS